MKIGVYTLRIYLSRNKPHTILSRVISTLSRFSPFLPLTFAIVLMMCVDALFYMCGVLPGRQNGKLLPHLFHPTNTSVKLSSQHVCSYRTTNNICPCPSDRLCRPLRGRGSAISRSIWMIRCGRSTKPCCVYTQSTS